MVKAETEIATFRHGDLSGKLFARAEADAVAQFDLRRGLRLSAEVGAEERATVQLREAAGDGSDRDPLIATVEASIGASARLAMAAQLDVNGLFAEACAAAQARARIRGKLSVSGALLLSGLADEFSPGCLAAVVAFLEEVDVHAGVFAEVYLAVRARARLSVTGSVIPARHDPDSGAFSVAFDYGYAYIFGAGISGYLDVDVPDVPRALGSVTEAAALEIVRRLPADTPIQVQTLLHMVVPLAAAVAVGRAVGDSQPARGDTTDTVGDVVAAFLAELRTAGLKVVMTAVLDAGMEQVRTLLDRALDGVLLDDQVRSRATEALSTAEAYLTGMRESESTTQILAQLASLFDAFLTFAEVAAPQQPALSAAADALAVAGAGAAVLRQVLGEDPIPGFPAATAARIRSSRPGLGQLSIVGLVDYLAAEIGLIGPAPVLSVGWLADIVGAAVPDLIGALWSLGTEQQDPALRKETAAKAVRAVVDQLTARLRPFLTGQSDPELRALGAFVDPLLDVIEVALLPLLTQPEAPSRTQATRMRDELDTLLTGVFGAIVVKCMKTVISPFFDTAEHQMRELARKVDRHDPAFTDFFALANEYDVVFRISEALVSAALNETADVLKIAKRTAFASAVELMEAFVLLPADSAERRAQLAVLAGSDNPRITDGQLRVQLLDALFAKSTEFAAAMIPPSVRMSTLIAVDQGPVPLATIYRDVVAIGESSVRAIEDAAAMVVGIGEAVASLLLRGKVTAEQLVDIGNDLKALIRDGADLAKDVLELVKVFSWPIFYTSTGGVGLLLRERFDAFFDAADWLIDRIHQALDRLTDALVEAAIAVAQDLGVLDTGEGEDMGPLGEAVRQRTLGKAGQPGLDLFDGHVKVTHAELATMVTNSAFAHPTVREKVRTFHAQAAEQSSTARRAALLLGPGLEDAKRTEAALRATLAAQQRPTGFGFTVEVRGFTPGEIKHAMARLEVAIQGAGTEFVTGPHPQVRVEVAGWPAAIAPSGWSDNGQGSLVGNFLVLADPALASPHPFIAEGMLNLAPQHGAASLPGVDQEVTAELAAVREIESAHLLSVTTASDPAAFLTRPIDDQSPGASSDLGPARFLPPVLAGRPPDHQRFPAVLALDRPDMIAAATNSAVAQAIADLPGTSDLAFISAPDLARLEQGSTSFTGSPAFAVASSARPRVAVVARARPGFTIVTATVAAVPGPGQDRARTPVGSTVPSWFVLKPDPEPPALTNKAAFLRQTGVPTSLPQSGTAQVSVTMFNAGTAPWDPAQGYRLASDRPKDNGIWGTASQPLPGRVEPNTEVTFNFTIKAPSEPPLMAPWFAWQIVQDLPALGAVDYFGETSTPLQIAVLGVDSAGWISQVVPGTIRRPESAPVSVTMVNNGTTNWEVGAGYALRARGHHFGAVRHDLPHTVNRGEQVTFSFNATAPPAPSSDFEWQMIRGPSTWFGARSPRTLVLSGEPGECSTLRRDIEATENAIRELKTALSVAPFAEKPAIRKEINEAEADLNLKVQRLKDLGCHS